MPIVVSPGCSSSSMPVARGFTFSQGGRRGSDQTSLPRRHQRRTCVMTAPESFSSRCPAAGSGTSFPPAYAPGFRQLRGKTGPGRWCMRCLARRCGQPTAALTAFARFTAQRRPGPGRGNPRAGHCGSSIPLSSRPMPYGAAADHRSRPDQAVICALQSPPRTSAVDFDAAPQVAHAAGLSARLAAPVARYSRSRCARAWPTCSRARIARIEETRSAASWSANTSAACS